MEDATGAVTGARRLEILTRQKRRTPGEAVSRLRGGHTPELAEAARKASALMGTNGQVTRLLSEA
jgi:hypothetical protein